MKAESGDELAEKTLGARGFDQQKLFMSRSFVMDGNDSIC